jgi:hypothetical protein
MEVMEMKCMRAMCGVSIMDRVTVEIKNCGEGVVVK